MWGAVVVVVAFGLFYLGRLSFAPKGVGSDATIHQMFVRLIRDNKHRSIRKIEPWLFGNFAGYPLFYHQLLSFLSANGLKRFIKVSNFIFNLIGVLLCSAFSYWVAIHFTTDQMSIWVAVLTSVAFYLFSPLLFDASNARNHGLSARSLGLLLGQLYTCALIIFLYTDNWVWAGASAVILVVSLLSSQFTFQYQLFSALILSLFLLDYRPAAVIGAGLIIYWVLFFKTAKAFFSFQIEHKKNFIKFNPFLRKDYGLWSYFFKMFWKELSWTPKKKWFHFVLMHNNAWLKIVTGANIVLVAVGLLVLELSGRIEVGSLIHIIWMVNLATVSVTILTSFKLTRFLGEPERYLDFCLLSTAASLGVVFRDQPLILLAIISIPFLKSAIILLELRKTVGDTEETQLEDVQHYLNTEVEDVTKIRLGANNMEIAKKLMDVRFKVFYGWMFGLYKYDPYKFFKAQWPLLEREYFFRFIEDYDWNMAVVDTNTFDGLIEHQNMKFVLLKKFGHLELYSVSQLSSKNK